MLNHLPVDEGVWAGNVLGVGRAVRCAWEAAGSTAACRVDGQVARLHALRGGVGAGGRRAVQGVRGEGAHASSRAWARFGRSSLCLSVDTTGQGCEVRSGAFAGECMHLNQAPHAAFIRTCRTAPRRERQCGKSCWRFFRLGEAARSDHFRPRTHGTAGRRARRRVAAAHIDGAHLTWSGPGVGMASMQPCAEERTARALTFGEAVDGCPH